MRLYCPEGFACDVTYGNGGFYKDIKPPKYKFDIDPQSDDVIAACSSAIPLPDAFLFSIVFDPPFLTYVRQGRNHNSVMAKRFAGYWRYDELSAHYIATLKEARRLLKKDGVLVFKCQDIIHNHKMHCTHANVIEWAKNVGFRLEDLFVLPVKHRMPIPPTQGHAAKIQRHARIHHSYFLVFK